MSGGPRAAREELDYRSLFLDAPEPIFVLDASGTVVGANRALLELLDRPRAEVVGRHARACLVDPEDWAACVRRLDVRRGARGIEVRLQRRDGAVVDCLLSVAAVDGAGRRSPALWQGMLVDIGARKRAEQSVLDAALFDALTGLPNRARFMDRLEQAVRRMRRRPEENFALLFIDLDRFKVVNDSLGHLVGDELLARIARRLEACIRTVDMVARMGGDEFAILLDGVDGLMDATRVAGRIEEQLGSPFELAGREVFASASIGITLGRAGYRRPDEALRDADIAMYQAKAGGRPYEIFDEGMYAQVVERLQLETDLRRAADRHEFIVHYQPIVSIQSGHLLGFEALLRWEHPERGLLLPDAFLGVAEEMGLVVPIGWRLLDDACRQLRRWQDRYPAVPALAMSVNMSARQLFQPDFVERVVGAVRRSGVAEGSLYIEITENEITGNVDSAAQTLGRLKAAGIRLSIDDFGTGYSSLSYLHRLPFDVLKIDRSFVSAIDGGSGPPELVWSIVALAHNLGMRVVGEGIETAEQLDELRALRCEYGQGFFFSGAVDGDAAAAFIAAGLPAAAAPPSPVPRGADGAFAAPANN